jgi:hypothetical protein
LWRSRHQRFKLEVAGWTRDATDGAKARSLFRWFDVHPKTLTLIETCL